MSRTKTIRYRKATRKRLVELLERIGYKVTKQSRDGTFMLIRLPDETSTGYWLFQDRLEHRLDNNRGGATFYLKECYFELLDEDTICVIAKENKSVFCMFHNFKTHRANQKPKKLKPKARGSDDG